MSEDKRGPQNLCKDDDNMAEGTETTFPSAAMNTQKVNSSIEGKSRDSAHEGILKKLPICTIEGNQEEMEECGFGSKLPELESSAVGDNKEASNSSGSVPNVIFGIEDLRQAFLSQTKNAYSKLKTIKNNLLETITDLKQIGLQNPENRAFLDFLEKVKYETYAVLNINKEVMSQLESIQQFINFQMDKCCERLREAEESSQGATVKVMTIEGVDVLVSKDCRASSAEENLDNCNTAMAFVDKMLQAMRLSPNAGAMAKESKTEVTAVGMEAERSTEQPRVMEEAADVNMVEVWDEDKMLPYPVTKKYTLAIKARQMYPESSSEDSPPEKPEHYIQGASENIGRGVDVMEVKRAEDPEEGSSSDSPIE